MSAGSPGAAALGLVIDRVVPEPPDALHPVAWFGTAMQRVESVLWRDSRAAGVAYAVVGAGGAVWIGRRVPTAAVTVVAVAGPQLRRVAADIGRLLEAGDLDAARNAVPALVGRDPSELDAAGISAAVIESVAENMVDAVVAPTFWAAVGGGAGVAAYRAINTMDAMVGHRSDRYRRFGWAAARLDDVANFIPARIFAVLIVAQRVGSWRHIVGTIRRDAPSHPSPNAGVAETAVASAIGRELGGPLRYGDRVERRPRLGAGPRPTAGDIGTAIRLADRAEWILTGAAGVAWLLRRGRR